MLQDGKIVIERDSDTPVLLDFCIYHIREEGLNSVQRYLAETPEGLPDDHAAALQAMSQARYSVFEVVSREPGLGIEMRDALCGDTLFTADVNSSRSLPIHAAMATRLIPFGDFWITGGAALPATQEAAALIQLAAARASVSMPPDWDRLPPKSLDQFVAASINACLQHDGGIRMVYDDSVAAQPSRKHQPTANRKQGRNDPCACGSGMKFKRCCGR